MKFSAKTSWVSALSNFHFCQQQAASLYKLCSLKIMVYSGLISCQRFLPMHIVCISAQDLHKLDLHVSAD